MKWTKLLMISLLAVGLGFGCEKKEEEKTTSDKAEKTAEAPETQEADKTDDPEDEGMEGDLRLTSDAFEPGGEIPKKYSCDGEKVSPPLSWNNIPQGTASFAIIASDPDAPDGTFMHWGVYGIPADETVLAEGIGQSEDIENGGKQAKNDFGKVGYGPVCPPKGEEHTYRFTLLALDTVPSFTDTPAVEDVRESVMTNVVARDTIEGTYSR